jgi:hypothetical protein
MKALGRVLGILGLTLAGLAASGAWAAQSSHAAVTLGSALTTEPNGSTQCSSTGETRGCLGIEDVVPGRDLVSPFDGVIVRWRARLGNSTDAQTVRIRVVRRLDADEFKVISSGELEDVAAGADTYTFPARLPIASGDQVGIEAENAKNIEWRAPLAGGRDFEYDSRPADGENTGVPTFTDNDLSHTFNVDVEPDADGDGFGDETQDQCPTDPSTQGPCPGPGPGPGAGALTLDLEAKKQELKKKIKFFATASANSTLVAGGKKIKDTTKQLAANQKTKVKAKLKRKPRERLEEKLEERGKAKVKVEGTATTQSGATAADKVKVKLKE